jgi:predicted DNA-binding transcriptional regulator AlpA
MIENLMSEDELCKALGLTKPTLQTWRSLRKGPPWIKVGRNIFFDKQKVESWLQAQTRDPADLVKA